jgi:hypothetical protein
MFLGAGFINAQFNWQGVLRDNSNNPVVNQNVSVQLSIMQNGSMIFRETHNVTTTDLGLMNLEVCDGVNVTGDCASIDWSDGSYMLNVAVDAAGGSNYEDYGNSPILMVPMASYANSAGSADTAATAGRADVATNVINDQVDDADNDPTNEIQMLEFDNNTRALSITGVQGFIRIPSTGGDGDPDPTNEVQQLSKNNQGQIILTRNNGLILDGAVDDEVDDADADPMNELQSLSLNGTDLTISGRNTVSLAGLGGGGGSSVWTRANQNIFYESSVPNNRIEFGPGIFNVGLGGTQGLEVTGGSNRLTHDLHFRTPNSGKEHGIGSYFQDFPVPDRSEMYMRMDDDTTFLVSQRNFTNETATSMNLVGIVQGTPVLGFGMSTQGGFGSFVQTVANQVGVRMGILQGGLPFVGISAANNPGTIVSFLSRDAMSAPLKNFNMEHPNDPSKRIWYACIEGPEAAAYERGTAELVNGEAFIPFSEHFELVINAETMTVNLTPNSAESLGLAVVEKTAQGIRVKELYKGQGNYSFDWEAKAVRKGYEDYRVIRDATENMIQTTLDQD